MDPNKIGYELESTDEILNKRKSSAKRVNRNNMEDELWLKSKKGIKTIKEQKFPIQNNYNRKNHNTNNYYKEEKVNIDVKEHSVEKKSEKSPQNIIEVESYTSPTFRKVDQKRTKRIFWIGYIFRRTLKIKGSANIRNYNMKTNNDKFIQFVQINNIKVDFKFNNEDVFELLIKGLNVVFKHKTPNINKEIKTYNI